MKILDLKDSHRYNLQFDVDGQFVKRTDNNLPVAKCKNLFKAKFNFIGDEWTGTKTALFAQGEYSKSVVLDDNDECVIPWEFFDTDENMTIGKVSVSCGDLVTTNCATVKITKSGYQESDASVPPSPDVYQQLIELAEDTKKIAQSVREDADAGEFDGEEGYSPKVSLTEELDGVTVTVQNKDGQQSAKVKNGKDGKNYEHSEEFTRLAEQVRQDKESVEQTKTAVDKTAQDFTLTAQQALADVNNAGQTQSERVQQVGQDAIADLNTAKTQAVETVNTTKSDAVKAVQTEGTKQTEAVQAKGQQVINSIPEDFTTQMATKLDKQQGTENAGKSLVIGDDGNVVPGEPTQQIEVDKTLTQEGQAADAKATGDKILQYAIKVTASGESIVLTDSAEEKLLDFTMQGKTEQTTTTGKNLFDVSKSQPGYYQGAQGNLIEYDENFSVSDFIQISDAQNKLCISPLSESTASFVVIFNENKEKIYSDNNSSIASRKGVIDIPTGAKYIRFSSRGIENVQAEYSDTPTDYEPYTGGKPSPSVEYPQEIVNAGDSGQIEVKVTGKNLFDISKLKSGFGAVKIDGNKITLPIGGAMYFNSIKNICPDLKVGDEVYIFADSTSANKNVYLYPQSGLMPLGNKITIKSLDDQLLLYGDNSKISTITNLMFTKVNDKTYETYKEPQTLTIQLDRPITKWDKIEKRDGVWGVVHKSKEVVFNGSEDEVWRNQTDSSGNTQFYTDLKDCPIKHVSDFVDNFYCDKFTKSSKASGDIAIGEVRYGSFGAAFAPVFKPKHEVGTLLLWRDLLKENPITILYETNSEEFVPLPQETQTALNALHTYYPTTVMSNSEDCEMEVTYVCDTKNYIDNKISENVASVISQYRTNVANLLSLMPLETQATMIANDTNNILEDMEEMKHE